MGGQTHPTFHPKFTFSMLDEILDAFDRGFSLTSGCRLMTEERQMTSLFSSVEITKNFQKQKRVESLVYL